jgi:mRNA interferase MazF
VTIVPITSNIESVHPFQVLLTAAETGLAVDSKAQAEQVGAVDVQRVGGTVGLVPVDLMARVAGALQLHLDL